MKYLLSSNSSKSRLFLALSFALLMICSRPLSAQAPTAGYDLLQTGAGRCRRFEQRWIGKRIFARRSNPDYDWHIRYDHASYPEYRLRPGNPG